MKIFYFRLLSLLFLILGVISCAKKGILTSKEISYLQSRESIKIAVYPYYPPYHFKDDSGELQGILIDYISLLEDKIGYPIERVEYDNFVQILQDAKENKIDLILEIQKTQSRQSYLNFYSKLFESPFVIIGNDTVPYGTKLTSLKTPKVAVPKDYAIREYLAMNFPNVTMIPGCEDDLGCLKLVQSGKADVYIGPKAVSNYFIKSEQLEGLRLVSELEYDYQPGIAATRNDTILNAIIYKGTEAITFEEKQSILSDWLFNVVTPVYRKVNFWVYILGIVGAVLLIVSTFNRYLKYKVDKRTRQLRFAKNLAEESSKLKTSFINNVSHEMRTPINGIMGFSGLLSKSQITESERSEYVQIISNGCVRLIEMMDNVLEISLLQNNQVASKEIKINLYQLVQNCFGNGITKSKLKGLRYTLDNQLDENHSTIAIDSIKLTKALNHLIDNAIKFTDEGSIHITAQNKDDVIELIVQDTGLGISDDQKEFIFDTYSKSSPNNYALYEGLGLGLAITKAYCHIIGSELSFISNKGAGTEFKISIPNTAKSSSNIQEEDQNVENQANGYDILIAEDGAVNYIFLKTLIERHSEFDLNIYRAANGKEAVALCEKGIPFNIIFMDIQMPVMDGYEATKLIKKLHPRLPIIAQTAYSTENDIQKAMAAGCDDFISKPVDPEAIAKVLSRYFA